MKRVLLALVCLSLAIGTVAAQQSAGLDLSSPKTQIFALNLGIGLGYDLNGLDTDAVEYSGALVATGVFGVDVMAIDKLAVGIEGTMAKNYQYTGLRLAYSLTDMIGFDLGFGLKGKPSSAAGTSPDDPLVGGTAISLGAFFDLFRARGTIGITQALRIGLNYITPTEDLGKGAILLATSVNFGL